MMRYSISFLNGILRLAVGTEYGLVVLDTKKNVLVQVIGSENKLLSELKNN